MLRTIFLAAGIAVLSGCAALRPQVSGTAPPSPALLAAWHDRATQLSPINKFTVRGRVSSGAVGFKADLRWKQYPDGSFQMRVAGPFGAAAAELKGNQDLVQVRTGTDQVTSTTQPEQWLEEALGVRLPVSGLRWWALGLPSPNTHFDMLLDPSGRALRIVQNGWQLDFPEYRQADQLDLPRRIEARNGDARVLVLADSWSDVGYAASVRSLR